MRYKEKLLIRSCHELEALSDAWARTDYNKGEVKRIVFVDDSWEVLRLVGQMLSSEWKFKLSFFEDEMSAIKEIYNNAPDLVILDVNLQSIDGVSVCKILDSLLLFKVPVIFITSDELFIRRFKTNRSHYTILQKPIIRHELISTIDEALSRNSA